MSEIPKISASGESVSGEERPKGCICLLQFGYDSQCPVHKPVYEPPSISQSETPPICEYCGREIRGSHMCGNIIENGSVGIRIRDGQYEPNATRSSSPSASEITEAIEDLSAARSKLEQLFRQQQEEIAHWLSMAEGAERKCASLKEDALRLDWLENECLEIAPADTYLRWEFETGQSLREAIDQIRSTKGTAE